MAAQQAPSVDGAQSVRAHRGLGGEGGEDRAFRNLPALALRGTRSGIATDREKYWGSGGGGGGAPRPIESQSGLAPPALGSLGGSAEPIPGAEIRVYLVYNRGAPNWVCRR